MRAKIRCPGISLKPTIINYLKYNKIMRVNSTQPAEHFLDKTA